ncbi:hypothetical protein G7085_11990 [Tessaracoccus sp. HDW20]|uniref:DUF5979 domain-containing protein n=1 Tax=Tessaracoccus coleopterorum TaxID=2714950 RepID=UPI0018D35B68|nr:hypothetical protein [Tessaracoccus coleopterorum]
MIKQVEGGQAPAQFTDGDFTFDYTCVPASGSNITGTLRMRNTGGASATGDIPAGSVCTVTERLSERPARSTRSAGTASATRSPAPRAPPPGATASRSPSRPTAQPSP